MRNFTETVLDSAVRKYFKPQPKPILLVRNPRPTRDERPSRYPGPPPSTFANTSLNSSTYPQQQLGVSFNDRHQVYNYGRRRSSSMSSVASAQSHLMSLSRSVASKSVHVRDWGRDRERERERERELGGQYDRGKSFSGRVWRESEDAVIDGLVGSENRLRRRLTTMERR